MNYVPVNGLRVLAAEICILLVMFVAVRLARPATANIRPPRWIKWILACNTRAVLFVIVLALIGRALLLPLVGVPKPRINDEYSYVLMGDTFAHYRLSNPTPPCWQHFETFHVNFTPTYHGKYPVAQGIFLAVGQILFHQPWIGVYLSTALLCGAICWALQGFFSPAWALIGGLLAVFRFALLSYWVNSYWGGSVAAMGGAIALGAVVRLSSRTFPTQRPAAVSTMFAVGVVALATSRPFEGLAFSLPLLLLFAWVVAKAAGNAAEVVRLILPVALIGSLTVAGLLYYNLRTTGNPLLMPYVLNEKTYSQLPLFFGQPAPHHIASSDPVFTKYYMVEAQEHGVDNAHSWSEIFSVEAARFGQIWFFYVGLILSFPLLIGVLSSFRQRKMYIVLLVAFTTALAVGLCLFTQVHYFAPATVTLFVFVMEGLHHLWNSGQAGERSFVIAVCLAVVATGLTRTSGASASSAHFSFPNTRAIVTEQLASQPGKHLVIVSYDMEEHYPGNELVHNFADFDAAKVLWARSKGAANDEELCRAYSDRTFWSLTTDDLHWTIQPLPLCK